jgi:hypothetical protein
MVMIWRRSLLAIAFKSSVDSDLTDSDDKKTPAWDELSGFCDGIISSNI